MVSPIKRTPEVIAAINAAEAAGDFEQAGYLMAAGLKDYTGETLEHMLITCGLIKAIGQYPNPSFELYNNGAERWIKEQIEQQNAVKH